MGSLKLKPLCFVIVDAIVVLLLSHHLAYCDEDEYQLFEGINSYRSSFNLPVLTRNFNAECLAHELAEELEDQPCPAQSNGVVSSSISHEFSSYPRLLTKCNFDPAREGAILPVCEHTHSPTFVRGNNSTAQSQLSEHLLNPKYTDAGVGSEDDWLVVVLIATGNGNGNGGGGGSKVNRAGGGGGGAAAGGNFVSSASGLMTQYYCGCVFSFFMGLHLLIFN